MKKILGMIGSGRTLGNCEVIVKEICRKVDLPHELRLLRLPEFDIRGCRGCYRCLFGDGSCPIGDDLDVVLQAIAEADALILAMPTYFLSAHSSLARFLDRGLSFYAMSEALWGKPAIGVGVAGIAGKEGSTLLDIERFFAALLADNKLNRMVYGALPGEVLLREENHAVVAELAAALFGPAAPSQGVSCPLCGGETFRFLADGTVHCMLCSDAGTLRIRDGRLVFDIEPGAHNFLAGPEEALRHRDWLRGMVDRYRLQRERLSELTAGYRDDGSWIKAGANRRP